MHPAGLARFLSYLNTEYRSQFQTIAFSVFPTFKHFFVVLLFSLPVSEPRYFIVFSCDNSKQKLAKDESSWQFC